MKWVGITGRSGSGKSSVTKYLSQNGCFCVDVDQIARRLLTPGAESYARLIPVLQNAFGYDIVDDSGTLNRQLLADRAFADPASTQKLNAITHPELLRLVERQAETARRAGETLFFVDGAAIVGSIFQPRCQTLVLVAAPYAASVRRICARDGLTEAQARQRLDAQTPEEVLRTAADYILENDTTLEALYRKTAALLPVLRREEGGP